MSENKTKDYVLRANQNYRKKALISKTITLNKEHDKDLIESINVDDKPFAQLVKELLRKHYELD